MQRGSRDDLTTGVFGWNLMLNVHEGILSNSRGVCSGKSLGDRHECQNCCRLKDTSKPPSPLQGLLSDAAPVMRSVMTDLVTSGLTHYRPEFHKQLTVEGDSSWT